MKVNKLTEELEDYKRKERYENYGSFRYILSKRKDRNSLKRLETLENMTAEQYAEFYWGGIIDLLFEKYKVQ